MSVIYPTPHESMCEQLDSRHLSQALVVYTPPVIPPLHEKKRRFELLSGTVEVEQDWGGQGGVGATVWPASLWLAAYVELVLSSKPKSRVLELGAGCTGLASIAAVRAGHIVLTTDGDPELMALLNRNVRSASSGDFRGAIVLKWGGSLDEAIDLLGIPDVVIAADVVYSGTKPYWHDFLHTLQELSHLKPEPAPLMLLAHMHRYREVDDDFFREVESAHFEVTRLPSSHLHLPAHRHGPGDGLSIFKLHWLGPAA